MDYTTLDKTVDLFKIYSDPTRLKIIHLLVDNEQCVHQITEKIDVSQSAISHSLRQLKEADVVNHRKEGKHVYYSLKDNHIKEIFLTAYNHVENCEKKGQ